MNLLQTLLFSEESATAEKKWPPLSFKGYIPDRKAKGIFNPIIALSSPFPSENYQNIAVEGLVRIFQLQ